MNNPDSSVGRRIIKGAISGGAALAFALNLAFSPKPPTPPVLMCNETIPGKTIFFQVGAHTVEHTLPGVVTDRLIPCFEALQRMTQ